MPTNRFSVEDFIAQHHHKNYCEAAVHENGDVCYAVPSHRYYLMNFFVGYDILSADDDAREIAYQKEEFMRMASLLDATKCALVWYDSYMLPSTPTVAQVATIEKLKASGVMSPSASICEPLRYDVSYDGDCVTLVI